MSETSSGPSRGLLSRASTRRWLFTCGLSLALAQSFSSDASAAEPKPAKKAAAATKKPSKVDPKSQATGKDEFEKGTRYFEAEEFEAALPWFQKAYELSGKRPATIFSLAQCERALKRYDEAILHFREYLATTPRPTDADEVERTLGLLEELQADQKKKEEQERQKQEQAEKERLAAEAAKAQPPPPPILPPPAPPPPESGSFLTNPIFLGAAGVVLVGAGVAIAIAASGEADPYGGTSGIILGP